jgi:hypothetical protein
MNKNLLFAIIFSFASINCVASQNQGAISVNSYLGVVKISISGDAAKALYVFLETPETQTNPSIKAGVNYVCFKSATVKGVNYTCELIGTPDGSLFRDGAVEPTTGFTISN